MFGHSSAVAQCLMAAACSAWMTHGLRQRPWRMVDVVAVTDRLEPEWATSLIDRVPDARLRLYCTGDLPVDAPCVVTENVGSEEYAFLKHIIDNFDKLAEVTIFTPRDVAERPDKKERLEGLVQMLNSTQKQDQFRAATGFESAPQQYFQVSRKWDGVKEACGPTLRPFGKWYNHFINATDVDWQRIDCTAAAMGNVFAVRSDRIRRIPLSVYKELMREVEQCRGHSSKVIGDYIERSWAALFADSCHRSEAAANLLGLPWVQATQQLQLQATQLLNASQLLQSTQLLHTAQDTQSLPISPHNQQQQQQQLQPKPAVAQAPTPRKSIDLVVGSYSAPLGWIEPQLAKLPGARLFLYCKGASTDPRCIRMENIGTEEYAFFTHILRHWDDLADITIFSKDNMEHFDAYKPSTLECLNFVTDHFTNTTRRNAFHGYRARLWFPVSEYFDVRKYHASVNGTVKNLCQPSLRPFGPWYLRFINPNDINFEHMHCAAASMHGIFAVSRDRIHRVPKSRFMDLMSEVERCRGQNAFVAGHYMERSWSALFAESCHEEDAKWNLFLHGTRVKDFREKFENAKVGEKVE